MNGKQIVHLVIPNDVTTLGTYVFQNADFKTVTLPDGMTTIATGAFAGCKMKSIYIPDSVTYVDQYALSSCSNLEVVVMNGVTSIRNFAIGGCYKLKAIYCVEKPSISDDGYSQIAGKMVTGYSCVTINGAVYGIKDGEATLLYADSGIETFEVHASIDYKGNTYDVTGIADKVFYAFSKLKNIVIPSSIESIGGYAFCGCTALEKIEYFGAQEQWMQVELASTWDINAKEGYTIHCTDGNITK